VPKKIVKMKKAFTLIELLVVIAILGILSGTGIVAYNGYTAFAKENATKNNHKAIVNNMENEFAKCKLDKDSKIFETHPCNSSSRPSTNTISNYANTKLGLKNPYDNTLLVVQSNICTSGSVSIVEKEIGNYDVAYASVKKQTKYNSLVSSGWSSNYSKTTSTEITYNCSTIASAPKNSFQNYTPPNSGAGAGIIVDKDGNIVQNGAHACSADCFKTYPDAGGMNNWYTTINGQKIYPTRSDSPYRFVMFEGASPTGNIASQCGGGNCKYNFADDTFTNTTTGKTFKAGE
jgi:prepilin-type N-terminal cleavage/methylation domain-containing protein